MKFCREHIPVFLLCALFESATGTDSEEEVISWDEASVGCQEKHDSFLLPQQYWEASRKDINKNILEELRNDTAAWIDGEVFTLGDFNGLNFRIHKVNVQVVDTKLPFLFDNGTASNVSKLKTDLPKESLKAASSSELIRKLQNFYTSEPILFWLPNITVDNTTDRRCRGLKPVNNGSDLEIQEYACTDEKMAVCVERSLLGGKYQGSLLLQVDIQVEKGKNVDISPTKSSRGQAEKGTTAFIQVKSANKDGDSSPPFFLAQTGQGDGLVGSTRLMDMILGSYLVAGVSLLVVFIMAIVMCFMCRRLTKLTSVKATSPSVSVDHVYEDLKKKSCSDKPALLRVSKKRKSQYTEAPVHKKDVNGVAYLSLKDSTIYQRRMPGPLEEKKSSDNPYAVIPAYMSQESVLLPDASPGETVVKQVMRDYVIHNGVHKAKSNEYTSNFP